MSNPRCNVWMVMKMVMGGWSLVVGDHNEFILHFIDITRENNKGERDRQVDFKKQG